jgi:hypothetical protein
MLNLRTTPYGVKDIADAVKLATQLLGFTSGDVAYNVASWEQMHAAVANASKMTEAAQRAETEARAEASERLSQVNTLREQLEHLEIERTGAAATLARVQQLLGEAQHDASLRYVPKRLIAKLTGWGAKGRSP